MEKYKTLAQASTAVKALGIQSIRQYNVQYKKDPQLVCNPKRKYKAEWSSWADYFGTENRKYLTLGEVANVVVGMGIRSSSEYNKRYKEDTKLVSNPAGTYKTDWISWYDFLGTKAPMNRYASICEASDATFRLGISSQSDYNRRYKEDEGLPSSPRSYYSSDWVSWYAFFKKNKNPYYDNLYEASFAAIKLGIKTGREYHKIYKKDKKLHCNPDDYYSNWTCWRDFLKTHVIRYKTVKEASKATKKLKIITSNDYMKRYKEDSLLPSNPASVYKDEWGGWDIFLGTITKYNTFIEASNNVAKMKILNYEEYRKRYKDDPRLYCQPVLAYGDSWTNWDDYLQVPQKKLINEKWKDVIKLFLNTQNNIGSKRSILHKFYFFYFKEKNPIEPPWQILDINITFNVRCYESFIFDQISVNQKPYHNAVKLFLSWLLESYCTDINGGEPIVLPGFRNPLTTLMKKFGGTLPDRKRLQESNKPILPLNVVNAARNYLIPIDFKGFSFTPHLQEIFDLDWMDICKSKLDFQDTDCVFRKKPNSENLWQIWCPARAVALYMLLKVPLRGQQILWLDSGENDAQLPFQNNTADIEWVDNVLQFEGVKRSNTGCITKLDENGVGMYINTNKTSTTNSGYYVPYLPHELALVIIRLRNWQSKYNPLKKLTDWREIKLVRELSKKLLEARGVQAFLFRNPLSVSGEPYMTGQVFAQYLPTTLYNAQDSGEKIAWKEGNRYKSWYTPHSIRTSLITAYVVDGGIPIHIVSKLVGHSSIVMTIYYTKVESRAIRRELDKAEKVALAKSQDRIYDVVMNDGIENAKGELFSKDKSFLHSIKESWPKSSYQITDKGICAMGGGGCHNDGLNENGKPSYKAVPEGYLGKRNCIRCRYFITGPAFLGGLAALCNEIVLETNEVASELSIAEGLLKDLRDQKYDLEISGKAFLQLMELNRSNADCEEKTMKMDVLLSDFAAIQSLMNECRLVLQVKENATSKQLVAPESLFEIDFSLEEQKSDFRLLNQICENAVLYSSASASRAIPLRSQALDKLALNNGLYPMMFKFTKEEQLLIGNQAAELIKSYVASWDDVDRLISGELNMNECFNITDDSLSAKFQNLLQSSEKKLLLGKCE